MGALPGRAGFRNLSALRCESSNMSSESGLDLGLSSTLFDAGDCKIVDFRSDIESAVRGLLEQNLTPISLGGDHSITYPILRAFHQKFPRLAVLHVDAHPDLYADFEGNPYSHASPFARVMEEGLIQRLVQIGIRTINSHQRDQAKKYGVEVHEMKDWNDRTRFEFDQPVYFSIDMDGLDPAFAPGVAHPEPGGLSTRQVIQVIQQTNAKIVGADIVELNPRRDVNGITAMVCAKLLKELAARILT